MRYALACLTVCFGCHSDMLLPPVDVPAPPVTPTQTPVAESNPPFVETACSRTPVTFVGDVRLGTTDGNVLFGFAAGRVVSVSLAGGPPQRLVDGVDRGSDLVVGTQDLYWLADGVVTRAPRTGGPAVPIGVGARRLAIAGDWLLYLAGDTLTTMLRSGGAPSLLARNATGYAIDPTSAWYVDTDNGEVRAVSLPASPAPQPDGPNAPMATDAAFVYRALADGTLVRVSRATNATDVLLARQAPTGWTQLTAAGDSIYGTAAAGLWRIARDGSSAVLIAPGASGVFAIAGNSVYFNLGPDVHRVCR